VEDFVLKRIFVEKGEHLRRSGNREIYFGKRLTGQPRIVRFIEHFNRDIEINGKVLKELWLVFRNEGKSLDVLMYEPVPMIASVVWEPSEFWLKMRNRETNGWLVRREILRQLLQALATLEKKFVTHRDIKPSNLLISEDENERPILKIGDFGAGVDTRDASVNRLLFGAEGAQQSQETEDYQPPEAIMNADGYFPYFKTTEMDLYADNDAILHAFDIWSCGIVALELLLGHGKVFAISSRTRGLVDIQLRRKIRGMPISSLLRKQSYYVASLNEFGIHPDDMRKDVFNETITSRDPFERGFYDNPENGDLHLDIVWQMLQWYPHQRKSAQVLLQHPYFA